MRQNYLPETSRTSPKPAASRSYGVWPGLALLLLALPLLLFPSLIAPKLWNLWGASAESQQVSALTLRAMRALPTREERETRLSTPKRVLTREPSKTELNILEKKLSANLAIHRVGGNLPPDFKAVQRRLKAGSTPLIWARSVSRISSYSAIEDGRSGKNWLLRVETPRPKFLQFILGLRILGGVLALLGIGISAASWFSSKAKANGANPKVQAQSAPPPQDMADGYIPLTQHTQTLHSLEKQFEDQLETLRIRLKESEETYRQMALNASDVLYAIYPDEGRIEWLGQIDLMLGYAHGSFPRTIEAWAESIHPDEVENILDVYAQACATGEEFQVEYRMRHRNGSYRDWLHKSKPVFGPRRKLQKLVGACSDITEKKRAEARLRESEERLAQIFETVAEAIVMVDTNGIVTFANPAAELIYGADRDRIVSNHYNDEKWKIFQPDGKSIEVEEMPLARVLSTQDAVRSVELSFGHASGQVVVASVNAAPLRDENNSISGAVLSMTDITGRKALENRLAFQAFHDPLTKLPNRALFTDRLGLALVKSKRAGVMIAVFFIDLDNFKKVNDTLGHDAGDELLKATAGRLLDSVRSDDTAARLAGDEFTIMLDNITEPGQAKIVADRVLHNLLQPITLQGQEVYAPPSIGIAFGNFEDTPQSLMERADSAMYVAKKNGKARYEVHEFMPEVVNTSFTFK
jgi:diguanylate cyclase (GGDEF)-like protein/PAS domain S-box-containing protein